MKKITGILFFLIPFFGFTQNFADKSYYLVDSLNLDEFIESDIEFLEKSLVIYHEDNHDTTKVRILNDISEYIIHDDWSKYQFFLHELIKESLKKQTTFTIKVNLAIAYGNSLNNIGFYYHSKGDLEMALGKYRESLEVFEKTENKKGQGSALNNIGSIYEHKGNIVKALDCFNQSVRMHVELNDMDGTASSLNNLAYIYNNQGEYKEGLSYFLKALSIRKTIKNKRDIASVLNNIGGCYNNMDNNTEALIYYNKALDIYEKIESKSGIGLVLNNIGAIYKGESEVAGILSSKKKELEERALSYYQRSLKIREEINDRYGIAIGLGNIGRFKLENGNLNEAKRFAEKSLKLGKEIGYLEIIIDASDILSEVYAQENKGIEALAMYQLHIQMRDSINNLEIKKAIVKEQAKHEYEVQKAIDDLKNVKLLELKQEEKEKQKIIMIAISVFLVFLIVFLFFIINRLKLTKRQNRFIEKQKQAVEYQKNIIEQAHKEITDSINYTKRLQDAILPSLDELNKYLPNNFVLFKPKDVVSGDFYWFEHLNNISYIAVADCTGHGVPGAMVSVVCSNALNRALKEFGIVDPAKILDKTRELVIETFAKSGDNVKDGMDITLCAFYPNKVVYAGANNPLWIVSQSTKLTTEQKNNKTTIIQDNNSLIEYKGNRQPIGLYEKMSNFSQKEIEINKGDVFYLFTDGFADQFGGRAGKKFKYKPFKQMLLSINAKQMDKQFVELANTFTNWKGSLEQIDDVCIIGIKF